ncbi:hypothetical protein GOV12_05040, partial [Candidatus Pacearchaeota archaeon]|nr:hypothetical protein [Candidatus Pacearchaeota archaeon]
EFLGLMENLVPEDLQVGDQIPDTFTGSFSKFKPYFTRLGIEDNLERVEQYVRARLDNLNELVKTPTEGEDHKEHWKRSEICTLTRILAEFNVDRREYQEAVDLFDTERENLEYKHHLSWRDQTEFAIRAGNLDKAKQLMTVSIMNKGHTTVHDNFDDEMANLFLQIGGVNATLDVYEEKIKRFKGCLVSGSYRSLYNIRNQQIEILGSAIGNDFVDQLRDYARDKKALLNGGMKLLPVKKE